MNERHAFLGFLATLGVIVALAVLATIAARSGKDISVYLATIASMTTLAAAFKPRTNGQKDGQG